MRRKDREMSKEFGIEVIDKSKYGVVSMIDKDAKMKRSIMVILLIIVSIAISGCSKESETYYFEPNVSIIEGTLITRLHYGPPNYGEDPENDEHQYPFILLLDAPINVIAEDTDEVNSDTYDVSEIQLALRGESYVQKAKQYKDKRIKVQGTLFSAFTGHHHTEVLMFVDEILE